VLDLVSQVRAVVLMNVYLDLGDPRRSGFWNEGYMGKGREMGRSVYEQPRNEVDGILSHQGGFQVSKGRRKGSKRKWEEGDERGAKGNEKRESRKQGDCSIIHCNIFVYIMNACNV
jgi:hypothetical protein